MKSLKSSIRKVLKSKLDISYIIRSKEPDKEAMNKKIFIEVLEQLKKIEERRDFLQEEIGMDMTLYEDQFFGVIENLFKMVFNKSQLALIQMYLYQLTPDSEWDGNITVEVDKKEKVFPFKSSEDVWNVINKFQK